MIPEVNREHDKRGEKKKDTTTKRYIDTRYKISDSLKKRPATYRSCEDHQ